MKNMKKIFIAIITVIFSVSFFSSVCVTASSYQVTDRKTVRVGYLENYATIIEPSRKGKMGYGYDFLAEVAKYTNWEYEFVSCEWDKGLEMLKQGEIDIFGPLQKTTERMAAFDFPNREMGYESATLCALKDKGIFYNDFQSFNDMTVAVDKDSFFLSLIAPFANENDIDLKLVHTPTADYESGIKSKAFDLVLSGSLMPINGTCVVARIGSFPWYYATTKGNSEILDGLNYALEAIMTDDIHFMATLEKKYFESSPNNDIAITREENDFVKSHPVVTVVSAPNFSPISFYDKESKEYDGITVDLLRNIGDSIGIKFNFIKTASVDESLAHLKNGQADLMLSDFNTSNDNLLLSRSIIDLPIVLLGHSRVDLSKELSVAMPSLDSEAAQAAMETYPNYKYIDFSTFENVTEAIISQETDLGLVPSYMADDIVREDHHTKFLSIPTGIAYPIRAAVIPGENHALISLINKATMKQSTEYINNVIFSNTVNRVYNVSFIDVLRHNPLLIIGIIFCFFAFMLLVFYLMSRRSKIKLQKAAYVDYLTGLSTKEKFRIDAEAKLKNASSGEYCIYNIDINNFKYINDAFGYTVGNRVLQAIGDHFREHSESYLLASRMQADTFVLMAKTPDKDLIIPTIQALHNTQSKVSAVLPSHYHVTFSTGVYIVDKPNISLDAMIDKAGTARKSVKGGYQSSISIYTNEIEEIIDRQKDITLAMEHALYNNEFLVYFQPKFDLRTNQLAGAEALVRWENPSRGFMMPNDFISLFEKNGFILKLDLYMFKQVGLIVRNIMNRYNLENHVSDDDFGTVFSVNLSKFSLTDPFIVEKICEILHQCQVPSRLIEIELTESLVTDDLENLLKIMERFRSKGFTVSIDDFGSGYSSLNLLKDLPVQIIKIDRAFLSQSSDTYRGQTIISSILHMAKLLGICTVAEGVENEEQIHLLRSMGCDIAQGYYYSKPLPRDEFIDEFIFPVNEQQEEKIII